LGGYVAGHEVAFVDWRSGYRGGGRIVAEIIQTPNTNLNINILAISNAA
jgi:hypothetical protein